MNNLLHKIIIALLGITTLGVGAVVIKEDKVKTIEEEQTTYLQENGKYKQIKRKDNIQVDEYVKPNGEAGYTISEWKTEGYKEYKKITDYGTDGRTIDWTLIKDNTPLIATTTNE